MAEYYAVERSPEYLAHYGIKGMRWGVRRAMERGNKKAVARHYQKAMKKLDKLNKAADVNLQKKQQIKYAKRAGIGLAISGLGTGGIFGSNAMYKDADSKLRAARNAFYEAPGGLFDKPANVLEKYQKTLVEESRRKGRAEQYKKAAAIADLAGLGYAGYAGTKSMIARHRTTPKGHAAAVARRNEFQREMNKTFANTKYGNRRRR